MDEVSLIREKNDIVSFIGEYVTLKRSGRNFKANCPFHSEKTPSFMVNPERQRWKCFGCQKGGDIYSFLMEYERLEFPEALRFFAKRAGVELSESPLKQSQKSDKEKIYTINNLAREYYHYLLTKHKAGKVAMDYLLGRGVTSRIIETFMLGFAPNTSDSLVKYLTSKKQYKVSDILEAGIASQWNGRTKDFFRGRIIFPLIDHRDNCIGFAGRLLEKNPESAKYINTRDTLAFHKGDFVYALNITKDAVRRANQVIVCEGEFDVISCFHNGITNVVGVKGTALTENQVNLLSRFAQKITFCFDGDKAGQEAIKRSLPIVEKKGLTATVVEIRDAKDPDEALQKEPGLFKKAVREDINAYDYLLASLLEANDSESAEGKKNITGEMLPLISNIQNEIVKEHFLKKTAEAIGSSYESIGKEIARIARKEMPRVEVGKSVTKPGKDEVLEEYLLSLIIQSDKPKDLLEKSVQILAGSMPKDRARQKILYHLLDHFVHTDSFDSKLFTNILPGELIESYDSLLLFPLPHIEDQKSLEVEVEKVSQKLKKLYVRGKMTELSKEIKLKEKEGKDQEAASLKVKYSQLSSLLS